MEEKKRKILIVDDEPDVRELLKFRLRDGEGFDIIEAKDGVEACRKAKTEKPDLIIMDIMMPVMGGYEACKVLKESEETKDIPVIMLTAKTTVGDMEKGVRAGASEYVMKPYDWNPTLEKIKKYIGDK
ncbi:MAG: response regulator [Candidatus Omnitrophota bacterium]